MQAVRREAERQRPRRRPAEAATLSTEWSRSPMAALADRLGDGGLLRMAKPRRGGGSSEACCETAGCSCPPKGRSSGGALVSGGAPVAQAAMLGEPEPSPTGGPGANAPMATSQSCSPSNPKALCNGKPRFTLTAHGAAFAVCDLTTDLQAIAPEARPHVTPAMVMANPMIPPSAIDFFSQPTGNKFSWDIQAVHDACLPDTADPDDFLIGFVQTAESLLFEATYTNGWSQQRVVPSRARDANPSTTPDPWFNPPPSGSLRALSGPVGVDSGLAPELADKLFAQFPIALPTPKMDPDAIPCAFILDIELTGKFTIWLVVQQVSTGALGFLASASVEISQIARRDPAKDPASALAWTGALGGKPFALRPFAQGKGAASPALGRPTANDFINIPLTFPGNPCPIKAPGSKPPVK